MGLISRVSSRTYRYLKKTQHKTMADEIGDDEDVSTLKFPKEFENIETLLNVEVAALLQNRKEQNDAAAESGGNEIELSECFLKTLQYCERFQRYNNMETSKAVRDILQDKALHKYEMAQLANLCPESAEEARSLIPSLEGPNRFDDEDLQEILDDIAAKKSIQS